MYKRQILNAGADKVSVNSAAVKRPELISEAAKRFGSQCVVCAIDAKRNAAGRWDVYLSGGRINTGIDAVSYKHLDVYKRQAFMHNTYVVAYVLKFTKIVA